MLHDFARHESIIHGEYNGDNSITTSKEKLTQQVNNMALTHNTNYQAVTESLNAPRAENARQHQELTLEAGDGELYASATSLYPSHPHGAGVIYSCGTDSVILSVAGSTSSTRNRRSK